MQTVTNLIARAQHWYKLYKMREEMGTLRYAKLICDWSDYHSICDRLKELEAEYAALGGTYE